MSNPIPAFTTISDLTIRVLHRWNSSTMKKWLLESNLEPGPGTPLVPITPDNALSVLEDFSLRLKSAGVTVEAETARAFNLLFTTIRNEGMGEAAGDDDEDSDEHSDHEISHNIDIEVGIGDGGVWDEMGMGMSAPSLPYEASLSLSNALKETHPFGMAHAMSRAHMSSRQPSPAHSVSSASGSASRAKKALTISTTIPVDMEGPGPLSALGVIDSKGRVHKTKSPASGASIVKTQSTSPSVMPGLPAHLRPPSIDTSLTNLVSAPGLLTLTERDDNTAKRLVEMLHNLKSTPSPAGGASNRRGSGRKAQDKGAGKARSNGGTPSPRQMNGTANGVGESRYIY